MDPDLNSYPGWTGQKRVVRAGQKARFYAINPERTRQVALFHRDQTEVLEEDFSTWTEIVTPDQRLNAKPVSSGPRAKVTVKGEQILVWVGSQKQMIEVLKDNGFSYLGRMHRWIAYRDNPDVAIAAMRKRGWAVELETEEPELVI